MQAMTSELSGQRRKIPMLFEEKSLKTVCSDSYIKKTGS
jgi:hypothetical protein